MTFDQIEAIYKANLVEGRQTALRAVWCAGFYAGQGTTLTATLPDVSKSQTVYAAVLKLKHQGET